MIKKLSGILILGVLILTFTGCGLLNKVNMSEKVNTSEETKDMTIFDSKVITDEKDKKFKILSNEKQEFGTLTIIKYKETGEKFVIFSGYNNGGIAKPD
ncbi:hypothetical protein FDC50_12755 [Clostridium botulinum]|uniref:Lipoprotein n=1 Tax=Clostridium botulinum TaxID=1491 RepID=A0A093VUN7_CLOBO|nr:hypothetical protein [Clostridium botulinum]AIW54680.1 uncharacterized protein [Clostridium botulinum]AIW54929.1 uncharacterized protein [Clostridium botulinum]AIW54984.1 uncharacterized protein [Clostridium botulinum]AIW55039.1 uncharacterized protein [Clostridium botulinum]KFX53724.1 hypothetical protein KU40_19165 [Clostridium botulinum]